MQNESKNLMTEHLSKSQIKWVRSLQQKKNRDAEGMFVAEGKKCVEELRSAFELVLLVTPDNATEVEIAQMSNLRTPQGVIGVFRRSSEELRLKTVLSQHISLQKAKNPTFLMMQRDSLAFFKTTFPILQISNREEI